ncbi:hypothetical protein CI109_106191 [Kwoniella shandongensis]|uniref:Uncharacterized protein n=1 Tax=Kwoniella shandongensis TaxID=1734106 RepID=A0AAJ8LR67_9TREE
MTQPSDPPPPSRRLFKTNPGTPDPWPQRKAAVGYWSGNPCRLHNHLARTSLDVPKGFAKDVSHPSPPAALTSQVVTQSAEPVATDYIPYQAPHNNAGFDPGPDPSQLAPVANIANGAINHLQSSSTTLAVPPTGKQSVRDWRQVPRPVPHVDPMPRSALFGLFTALMLSTHINLIITGKTTVESFKARDQQEQEDRVLQQEYGYLWHNQEKRKVRKRWKEEYGGTAVDARWRHGSSRDMWEQEMGTSPWGWILHFKSNPHFGPHGEWLMKKDW